MENSNAFNLGFPIAHTGPAIGSYMPTKFAFLHSRKFKAFLGLVTISATIFSAEVLLMAQALERAGDHATNLAEELFRLIEGRSMRHPPKRQVKD